MRHRQGPWTMAERDARTRSADSLATLGLVVILAGVAAGTVLAVASVTLAAVVIGVLLIAAAANRRARP